MMAGIRGTSFYEVLEVGATATREEIEASYQRILTDLDSGSLALYSMVDDGETAALRNQVDEAYHTLSDPARRAAYDRGSGQLLDPYPSVLVPEESTGSSVSVGRVEVDDPARRDASVEPGAPHGEGRQETAHNHGPRVESAQGQPPTPSPDEGASDPAPALQSCGASTAALQPRGGQGTPPVGSAREDVDSRGRRRRRFEPSVEVDISVDTEFSGALLRRLRESAGASLDDIAELTKISKRYIRALEGNDFDSLPAPVYVRGFVSEYARVLGLDAKAVARSFMSLYERYRGERG